MCDVDDEAVVAAVDAPSIYDIPKVLHREGLDAYVVRRLGLPFRDVDWTSWDDLLRRVHIPAHEVTRRIGRQVHRPSRCLSVCHARHFEPADSPTMRASTSNGCLPTSVQLQTVPPRHLAGVDAMCVPGGFGVRGIEGKVGALKYAREHQIPTSRAVPWVCSAW